MAVFSALLLNMFNRLQEKWKVKEGQMALIIATFAIGGSVTGYAAKKIMNELAIGQDWLWAIVYILLIIIIWPLAVLVISIPMGQFPFFINYIRKIGKKMGLIGNATNKTGSSEFQSPLTTHLPIAIGTPFTNIAIFASGAGTNAQKIIDHFRNHSAVRIALIACNDPEASVLKIAAKEKIPIILLKKEQFFRGDANINELKENGIDFIVLAGFLWKLPAVLIKAYHGRIINIHPALLPKYGGKGMFGHQVHQAVIDNKETESGISIHYVDEQYDHGKIIFQARCPVLENDTAETLAERIHQLEHEYYPKVISELVN